MSLEWKRHEPLMGKEEMNTTFWLGNLKGRLMRNQVVKGKILRHFPGITWRD
jgi:hypothetical protein